MKIFFIVSQYLISDSIREFEDEEGYASYDIAFDACKELNQLAIKHNIDVIYYVKVQS